MTGYADRLILWAREQILLLVWCMRVSICVVFVNTCCVDLKRFCMSCLVDLLIPLIHQGNCNWYGLCCLL